MIMIMIIKFKTQQRDFKILKFRLGLPWSNLEKEELPGEKHK